MHAGAGADAVTPSSCAAVRPSCCAASLNSSNRRSAAKSWFVVRFEAAAAAVVLQHPGRAARCLDSSNQAVHTRPLSLASTVGSQLMKVMEEVAWFCWDGCESRFPGGC